ncbi:hypothetical protein D1164_10320 [Mariniphaga sediminis]|uniref:Uncharacterized protein n=1 Tax=Mariniphaga sediminis TaxID=1628158 RepID=A0A399D0W7_9BACT|nr:hypothetical protein D1164_10320 [Mariniphaga sediminis]
MSDNEQSDLYFVVIFFRYSAAGHDFPSCFITMIFLVSNFFSIRYSFKSGNKTTLGFDCTLRQAPVLLI